MASRDAYRWPWMRKQYEEGGLAFRKIAALHLATFGVHVSSAGIAKRAETEGWVKSSKVDKVDTDGSNLVLVPGGSAESGQSGQPMRVNDVIARQVFVLDRHRSMIGNLHTQIERLNRWADEYGEIMDEEKRLQHLMRDTKSPVADRMKEMSGCLRVLGFLRANAVDISRAIGTLVPLEREAYNISTNNGKFTEERAIEMDEDMILVAAEEIKFRRNA